MPEKKDLLSSPENAEREAKKFYNYFRSVGWTVGKNRPMKDWKAAAENWVLNIENYSAPNKPVYPEPKRNPLHAERNKNYAEPL